MGSRASFGPLVAGVAARIAAAKVRSSAQRLGKACVVHDWPELNGTAKGEFDAAGP